MATAYNIAENKKYKWTTSEGERFLNTVPRIFASAYKVNTNAALASLKNWLETATATRNFEEYYNDLHQKAEEMEQWTIPFFDDKVRSFTNEWGDSAKTSTDGSGAAAMFLPGLISEAGKELANLRGLAEETMKGAVKDNIGGTLFEPPKFYQYGASDGPLTVEFVLINTENAEDVDNNYNLVKNLIANNRFARQSNLIVTPPYLWSITVPGYRYIRWAACNVDISLLGHREIRGEKIVPEGYKISLMFNSLYTEPSNYMVDRFLNTGFKTLGSNN